MNIRMEETGILCKVNDQKLELPVLFTRADNSDPYNCKFTVAVYIEAILSHTVDESNLFGQPKT